MTGGFSARVRDGRCVCVGGERTQTHTCTPIPTQTQVIPLEEEDVELT